MSSNYLKEIFYNIGSNLVSPLTPDAFPLKNCYHFLNSKSSDLEKIEKFFKYFKMQIFFFIAFIIWSFPSGVIRSRFRKMVYKTDSWLINIQPYFLEEAKVLFGFHNMKKKEEIVLINFYRFYLIIYLLLFAGLIYF
jgi:hypothetical protein